jgi:hypothetical protein
MEIRDATVKYIGQRRTKALSLPSELDALRFRSSLFTIFFEPRMSEFQGKLSTTFLTLSIELQFGERMVVLKRILVDHNSHPITGNQSVTQSVCLLWRLK